MKNIVKLQEGIVSTIDEIVAFDFIKKQNYNKMVELEELYGWLDKLETIFNSLEEFKKYLSNK